MRRERKAMPADCLSVSGRERPGRREEEEEGGTVEEEGREGVRVRVVVVGDVVGEWRMGGREGEEKEGLIGPEEAMEGAEEEGVSGGC